MNIIWAAIALVVSIECFVEQDPVLQCKHGLVTDARFSSIKRHLSLSTHCETTPDMLADPTFPNEEQQKAIAQWMSAHSECHSRAQPRPSESTSSALAGRLDEIESAMIFDAADLYQRRISFGEFNQRRQALWTNSSGEAGGTSPPLRSKTTQ